MTCSEMKYFYFLPLFFFLTAFESKADTITFWHIHKNEMAITDNCFDNKKCFHHDLSLTKAEIKATDVFYILFGGCFVPQKLTISLKSVTGKQDYSFQLIAKRRGDFTITPEDILKITHGEYSLRLYCDEGDELYYWGSLLIK